MEQHTARRRKSIGPKLKLQVLQRDNFSCKLCGRSPVIHPGLSLEVDHIQPFSKEGKDELANYQALCLECNRGKGNNEHLNQTIKNELDAILNSINPQILQKLAKSNTPISVVANQEDFANFSNKNSLGNFYLIEQSTNTISGYHAGKNLGIYTINDFGGSKINFFIQTGVKPRLFRAGM